MNEEEIEEISESFEGKDADEAVVALIDELQLCYEASSDIAARRRKAADWRYCRWPGQSEDGRKHASDDGVQPHPFEGAPDTRIHLVDELINEDVGILFAAFFGSKIQAEATCMENLEQSGYVSMFLDWLRGNALQAQLVGEVELLAQMQQGDDPGLALLGVFWDPNQTTVTLEASPEDLLGMAAQANLQLEPAWFRDAENGERADVIKLLLPKLERESIVEGLKAFDRDEKAMTMKFASVAERGLPKFRALRPGDDVWLNWVTDDLQEAPAIFMRELLPKVELLSRVESEGYDEDWVKAVLAAGAQSRAFDEMRDDSSSLDDGLDVDSEANRTYEIWRAYRKVTNGTTRAPEVRLTVFSYFVAESLGLDERLEDNKGMYPFIPFRREHVARGLLESRGVSRVAATHQNEIKVSRDCWGAALQVSTLPPVKYKMIRGGLNLALSPGRQVPVRAMDDLDWMQPPPFPAHALEMERATREDVDSYFGRIRPDGSPTRGHLVQQRMVTKFLIGWSEAFRMALQLCQRYMPPREIAAVLSVRLGEEVTPSLDGEYTLNLPFDVRDLDMEFVKGKLDVLGIILGMDTNGIIDRGMVADMMHAVSPYLAKYRVRDIGAVTEAEQTDERMNLLQAAAGLEPPMKETGQNFGLRLQTLQSEIQKSPKLMKLYQEDESFQELINNRMKHLGFMVEQQQNAQIGRVGAKPLQ